MAVRAPKLLFVIVPAFVALRKGLVAWFAVLESISAIGFIVNITFGQALIFTHAFALNVWNIVIEAGQALGGVAGFA